MLLLREYMRACVCVCVCVCVCLPGNQVSHLHINGLWERGWFLFECERLNVYGVLFLDHAAAIILSNHPHKQNRRHSRVCVCVCVSLVERFAWCLVER